VPAVYTVFEEGLGGLRRGMHHDEEPPAAAD